MKNSLFGYVAAVMKYLNIFNFINGIVTNLLTLMSTATLTQYTHIVTSFVLIEKINKNKGLCDIKEYLYYCINNTNNIFPIRCVLKREKDA